LLGNECEFQLFDLNSTLELKLTVEPKLDLSHIVESVSVPKPITLDSKSTTPPNHIPLLDLGIHHYDSEMIF